MNIDNKKIIDETNTLLGKFLVNDNNDFYYEFICDMLRGRPTYLTPDEISGKLMLFCERNTELRDIKQIEEMLKNGANINAREHIGNSLNPELYKSPLSLSIKNNNHKLTTFLLEHGAEINDIRAVWFSIINNNYDFLQKYIELYKNLKIINKALFIVIENNNTKMADFLLANSCDPNFEPKPCKKPIFFINKLDMFLVFKKYNVVYTVLNEFGDDIILNAVKKNYEPALINYYVKKLCISNVRTKTFLVDLFTHGTASTIINAAVIDIFDLKMLGSDGIGFKYESVVKMLLTDLNILDKYISYIGGGIKAQSLRCKKCNKGIEKMTVLHIVVKSYNSEILKHILEKTTKDGLVNSQDSCGRTPLHYCDPEDPEYLIKNRLLTKYGANPRIIDHHEQHAFPVSTDQIRTLNFQNYFNTRSHDAVSIDAL